MYRCIRVWIYDAVLIEKWEKKNCIKGLLENHSNLGTDLKRIILALWYHSFSSRLDFPITANFSMMLPIAIAVWLQVSQSNDNRTSWDNP